MFLGNLTSFEYIPVLPIVFVAEAINEEIKLKVTPLAIVLALDKVTTCVLVFTAETTSPATVPVPVTNAPTKIFEDWAFDTVTVLPVVLACVVPVTVFETALTVSVAAGSP